MKGRRGTRLRLTDEQRVVDAIREIMGLAPLYEADPRMCEEEREKRAFIRPPVSLRPSMTPWAWRTR